MIGEQDMPLRVTPLSIARRWLGTREVPGEDSNPAIVAMLRLVAPWANHDAVAWCSAFVFFVAWLLGLETPPKAQQASNGATVTPAAARSWLTVGIPVELKDARPGFDVVILERGRGKQPGPEVLSAPGHVGFFAGMEATDTASPLVLVLGGNQGDAVTIQRFDPEMVLGVRRLRAVA